MAFERAGGECLFASELDRFAQLTYKTNFGHQPAGDIRTVLAKDIPAHDVLVAGFPCQPFSLAGVSKKNSLGKPHGFSDEAQGTLFFEIVKTLKRKRPPAFLLENVAHLRTHNGGQTFATMLAALERDYDVSYDVLDAKLVVPQQRRRLFLVGFRKDLQVEYRWPRIQNRGPTIGTILEKRVDAKYTLNDHLWQYLQDYSRRHREAGNGFGCGVVGRNGVARTLSARYYKDGAEILVTQRGKNPRRLSPRECARLMGFPDTFEILVSDTQAYKQFGNSVVVPLVERVARSIARQLPH